jgi:DNA ligase-associated metallophosphoesterase
MTVAVVPLGLCRSLRRGYFGQDESAGVKDSGAAGLARVGRVGQIQSMNAYEFRLGGVTLRALPSGALHWPGQGLLCVSDLHFGKAERLARRGGALLPPYDTEATLARLDSDLEATGARQVICLGDSFDDLAAAEALPDAARLWLLRLTAGRDWTWILGNHDPAPQDFGGSHRAAHRLDGLTFRHIATADTAEVSGHYHPKASVAGRSRPCFLLDAQRLILPAYGSYTGGLASHDPVLTGLMGADALAILTGARALAVPMPRMAPKPGVLRR